MLEDFSTYTKVTSDPTGTFQIHSAKLVEEGISLGVLSPKQVEYISNTNYTCTT